MRALCFSIPDTSGRFLVDVLDIARFWSRVTILDAEDCWFFSGSTSYVGYGQFRFRGKLYLAHRIAYMDCHGAIPTGLVIRHQCDQRLCCNPNHLIVGSQAENIRDAIQRGRFGSGKSQTEN